MSDKRISISLDEYNMLHTETLAQKDTITRLTEERDALADDRDGYVQLLTDQNTRLTADNEKLAEALETAGRLFAASRDALAEVNAENEKLRAALREIRLYSLELYATGVAHAALSGDKHE